MPVGRHRASEVFGRRTTAVSGPCSRGTRGSAPGRFVGRLAGPSVVTTSTQHQDHDAASGQTNQPAWESDATAVAGRTTEEEASNAPTTATPRVAPTCREVEAIAEATPAWARGMPDTAAVVMGALTNPNPIPNTT